MKNSNPAGHDGGDVTKLPDYFKYARPEILALVPVTAQAILELGCAAGQLGKSIKTRQKCHLTGVELHPAAAGEARKYFDEVLQVDLNAAVLPFAENSFDTVICADVLEHLADPWGILAQIQKWLRPGGQLICSIPNIANLGIIAELAGGAWNYATAGILDRTHLRFFTRATFQAALQQQGFQVSQILAIKDNQFQTSQFPPDQQTLTLNLGRISLRDISAQEFAEFTAVQFLFTGIKPAPVAAAVPAPAKPRAESTPTRSVQNHPVTIIMPVCNRAEQTRACLEAILQNTPGDLFGLVMIDNGSSDSTAALLQSLEGSVQVISLAGNQGVAKAFNLGAKQSASKYLVFLSNDTLPQPGWLEALIKTVEANEKIGAVGPCLLHPDGRLQAAGSMLFANGSGWDFGLGDDATRAPYREAYEVDFCSSTCLLVRRDLFEQVGGFDEQFSPAYFEDADLGFALRRLGHEIWYSPESLVVHVGNVPLDPEQAQALRQARRTNKEKFIQKWKVELSRQEASPAQTSQRPITADRRKRFTQEPIPA